MKDFKLIHVPSAVFLIIQKPYCRVTDFLDSEPWILVQDGVLQCRINDFDQGKTNTHTHNECLVCKEHKTFREFKVVKLISALVF